VDTMQAILRREPPDLPGNVPAGIRHIVQHCLEKDPAQRFHSAPGATAEWQCISPGRRMEP
jgi:serine/threonine protein kinase